MTLLIAIISLTLGISFLCSILEGFILSITTSEIEAVKQLHPRTARRLELYKNDTQRTIASILILDTVANIVGSTVSGFLVGKLFGSAGVGVLTAVLTIVVLLFCQILPKNIGVIYRQKICVPLTRVLDWVLFFMRPIANLCGWFLRHMIPSQTKVTEEEKEQEVLLLVNKGHRDGFFTVTEREIISNTLELDNQPITSILTPIDRVFALDAKEHISSALRHIQSNNFSRFPVYDSGEIIGIIHRSDLLHIGATDYAEDSLRALAKPILRLNDHQTIADAMQILLKNRQKICIVDSPSNQTLGIVALRDIIEYLLGQTPSRNKRV